MFDFPGMSTALAPHSLSLTLLIVSLQHTCSQNFMTNIYIYICLICDWEPITSCINRMGEPAKRQRIITWYLFVVRPTDPASGQKRKSLYYTRSVYMYVRFPKKRQHKHAHTQQHPPYFEPTMYSTRTLLDNLALERTKLGSTRWLLAR